MAKVMTQIRIDEEVKKKSTEVLNELGLDMTTAINLFLRQVIINKGIPFSIKTEECITIDTGSNDELAKRLSSYVAKMQK